MLPRDGIGHRRFCLDRISIRRVLTCGVWAVFWLSCCLGSQFFLVLRRLISLIELWKWRADQVRRMLSRSTVLWHKPCSKVYHQRNQRSWEICSPLPARRLLICWRICCSLIQIRGWRLNRHCSTHMSPNSTTQRKSQSARRKFSFQLTIIKNSRSRSIVTSCIQTSTNVKRKWERRFWHSIRRIISRWEGKAATAASSSTRSLPVLNNNNTANNNNINNNSINSSSMRSSSSIDNLAKPNSNNTSNSTTSSNSTCEENYFDLIRWSEKGMLIDLMNKTR